MHRFMLHTHSTSALPHQLHYHYSPSLTTAQAFKLYRHFVLLNNFLQVIILYITFFYNAVIDIIVQLNCNKSASNLHLPYYMFLRCSCQEIMCKLFYITDNENPCYVMCISNRWLWDQMDHARRKAALHLRTYAGSFPRNGESDHRKLIRWPKVRC